jgi:hypothetical protein
LENSISGFEQTMSDAQTTLPVELWEKIASNVQKPSMPVVLIYHRSSPAWSVVKIRREFVNYAKLLKIPVDPDQLDEDFWTDHVHHHGNQHGTVTELVHLALSVGFRFPDSGARERAMQMEDFEMYKE